MLERAAAVSWRVLLLGIVVFVVLAGISRLRLVILPVFVGLLATTLLRPPAVWLRSKGLPPLLATWITFLVALGLVGGGIALLVPQISGQFDEVGRQVQAAIDDIRTWLQEGPLELSDQEIDRYLEQLGNQFGGADGGAVFDSARLVAEVIAGILLALVLTFFFVKDGERLWGWLVDLVPERHRDLAEALGTRSWATLGAYLRGTAIVGLVDAFFIGLGLVIIGVPLVLPLAVITFFGAFFPLVGAVVAGAVAAMVALVTNGLTDALLVTGVVLLVQQIEGDVLAPLVMGRAVQLHPVVILVALTTGAVIGGIMGAFLAVPFTAIGVQIGTELRRRHGEDVGEPVEALGSDEDGGDGRGDDRGSTAASAAVYRPSLSERRRHQGGAAS